MRVAKGWAGGIPGAVEQLRIAARKRHARALLRHGKVHTSGRVWGLCRSALRAKCMPVGPNGTAGAGSGAGRACVRGAGPLRAGRIHPWNGVFLRIRRAFRGHHYRRSLPWNGLRRRPGRAARATAPAANLLALGPPGPA